MKPCRLYRRGGIFYAHDSKTGKQRSLHTKDRAEAERLIFHEVEAGRNPAFNRDIGRAYLAAADPELPKRTWQMVFDKLETRGGPSTRKRVNAANRCRAFDLIRQKPLVETRVEDLLKVLEIGGSSVNHFMRRNHNLALNLLWLPHPILSKLLWPPIRHKKRRPIREDEHLKIIAREPNKERRLFYELLWETGASQSDAARLTDENIDWPNRTLKLFRQKIEHLDAPPAVIKIGRNLENILRQLPAKGALFPYLKNIDCKYRGTEFHERCEGLGIHGVSLHSYRYAWACRARQCGMPERYAQAVLGHGSKAIARAYARSALMEIPSLEEYEALRKSGKIIPMNLRPQNEGESRNSSIG